jgi:hypothetical protein
MILAYGQSGSGKSFTILGDSLSSSSSSSSPSSPSLSSGQAASASATAQSSGFVIRALDKQLFRVSIEFNFFDDSD